LALLNARLPDGSLVIPTPQPDGHYSGSAISIANEDQFNANFDYHLNQRDTVTAKFFFSNGRQFLALPSGGASVPGFGADQNQNNRLLSIQYIHIFGPRTVNEARAGYSLIAPTRLARIRSRIRMSASSAPTPVRILGLGLIRVGPTGGNALTIGNAGTNIDTLNRESSTTFVDILSFTRNKHSIRAGGGMIYYANNLQANNNRRGTINFQSFNNFLAGTVNASVYADGINTRLLRTADYNLFLQDDWRFSERLTLNFGLRYELDLPPYEIRGGFSTFDPSLYKPRMEVDSSGLPVGPTNRRIPAGRQRDCAIRFADVPNVGKRILNSVDPNNFAPRVGFAYSPFKSARLVLRGGYGIYYSRHRLPTSRHRSMRRRCTRFGAVRTA